MEKTSVRRHLCKETPVIVLLNNQTSATLHFNISPEHERLKKEPDWGFIDATVFAITDMLLYS